MKQYVNCGCCRRSMPNRWVEDPESKGLCDGCAPTKPGAGDGCKPKGYGNWERQARCRVKSKAAARRKDAPLSVSTGRALRTVKCRWCDDRFPLWAKDKGRKISWSVLLRNHCKKVHKKELAAGNIWRPQDMTAEPQQAVDRTKKMRMGDLRAAVARMKGGG